MRLSDFNVCCVVCFFIFYLSYFYSGCCFHFYVSCTQVHVLVLVTHSLNILGQNLLNRILLFPECLPCFFSVLDGPHQSVRDPGYVSLSLLFAMQTKQMSSMDLCIVLDLPQPCYHASWQVHLGFG